MAFYDAEAEERQLKETCLKEESIFDGQILHVSRDTVQLPNGASATREYIRHIGAVAIIPITENNEVIMERQFRYPGRQVYSEIPAGKLDRPDEDRLSAAKRELQEETGYTADEWIDLGDFHTVPAYSNEVLSMYLARGLHLGARKLDEDEFLNVYKVPLVDLVQQVMNGQIREAKTQVAILKAARYLNI